MRKIVYLFKTDGEPIHFNIGNKMNNSVLMVYFINDTLPDFKICSEHRIDDIFIDPSFQKETWFWKSYMAALHRGNSIMYNFITE